MGAEGLTVFGSQTAPTQTAPTLILLDTNAVLWLLAGHPRGQPLARWAGRLYISPVNILEVQFLVEGQRIRMRKGAQVADLARDPRWLIDDPPAVAWFEVALNLSWTRDPFDRLLLAHSKYRGWRLATSDAELIRHLTPREVLEL